MLADFGIGLLIGAGGTAALFGVFVVLAFAGWMNSGSH